jgi:hypothetical protein
MKTARGRSARWPVAHAGPATAPSAYSRLVGGQIVKAESAESSVATHTLVPRQSLMRLTLIRGYGHEKGARRFAALEQICERLRLDDNRVRAIYSTILLHVDVAIDRRLLQPLAAQRDAQRRDLAKALTTFTTWYRGHLYGPRTEGQQLLPESLLLQAVDTLRSALEQDPLMSRPIDPRFKRTTRRQRTQEAERARQALRAWGIGKRDADQILKCVGLSGRDR